MTSARQKKRMAAKDRQANKKFILYVGIIVVIVLILMYFIFANS